MTKAEIISSLLAQARDKDALANGEADSIFADDARALREAAELLKSVPADGGEPCTNAAALLREKQNAAAGRFPCRERELK